jgi:hypothetical protein
MVLRKLNICTAWKIPTRTFLVTLHMLSVALLSYGFIIKASLWRSSAVLSSMGIDL